MARCKIPRLTVRRVKLTRDGYEPGKYGQYYGVGQKFWTWEAGDADGELRAPDYAAARKKARVEAEKKLCDMARSREREIEYDVRRGGWGGRSSCKFGKVKSGPRKGKCRLKRKRRR